MKKTLTARRRAALFIAKNAKYYSKVEGGIYAVRYCGKLVTSDDTADLADQVAELIRKEQKR